MGKYRGCCDSCESCAVPWPSRRPTVLTCMPGQFAGIHHHRRWKYLDEHVITGTPWERGNRQDATCSRSSLFGLDTWVSRSLPASLKKGTDVSLDFISLVAMVSSSRKLQGKGFKTGTQACDGFGVLLVAVLWTGERMDLLPTGRGSADMFGALQNTSGPFL